MLLERGTVSRKTPRDGRLEITEQSAKRLRECRADLRVIVGESASSGAVSRMTCTCRGAGAEHEHHFLESEVLRTLTPESAVALELLEDPPRVVVRPVAVTT